MLQAALLAVKHNYAHDTKEQVWESGAEGLEQQFSSLVVHENQLGSISNRLVPSRKSKSEEPL